MLGPLQQQAGALPKAGEGPPGGVEGRAGFAQPPIGAGGGRAARDHEGPCASAWRAGRRRQVAPPRPSRPTPCLRCLRRLAYYRRPPYSYIQEAKRGIQRRGHTQAGGRPAARAVQRCTAHTAAGRQLGPEAKIIVKQNQAIQLHRGARSADLLSVAALQRGGCSAGLKRAAGGRPHRDPKMLPSPPNKPLPPPLDLLQSTLPRSMSTTATLSWLPRFTASSDSRSATSCSPGREQG